MRICEDDIGFVVNVGIDIGLDVLGDCGDGGWRFAAHEPCHEIRSVAAEIIERAGTVEFGICEESQEFGLHVDFARALMAVADDDFANIAEFAFIEEIFSEGVAGIPSGFVIDKDVNLRRAREFGHAERVVIADGERFFHHDVNVRFSAGFDSVEMFEGVGIADDAFRFDVGEHLFGGGEIKIGAEVVLFGVFVEQGAVWFGDADDLDVVTLEGVVEEAGHVTVSETDDRDFEWRRGVGGECEQGKEENAGHDSSRIL